MRAGRFPPSTAGLSTPRPLRNILLLGLVLFTTLAIYNRGTRLPLARGVEDGFKRTSKYTGFNPGTHNMQWPTHGFSPLDSVESHYHDQAHTLQNPDDFFPHFKAVLELPGMTLDQTMLGCNWGDDYIKVNFQYTMDQDWVQQNRPNEEIEYMRAQWQKYVAQGLLPYSSVAGKFSGRGIAMLAGNEQSYHRVPVFLRQMVRLKSRLPVEIVYWKDELNETARAAYKAIYPNLYFNDLSGAHNAIQTNHDNIYNLNYQMKPVALLNSRFAEVLFLDSDNVPAIDPELIFESGVYQKYGSVFWPDIARTRPQNPMWPITNTMCKMDEYELESGQLAVNKARFFYHLQLAAWYNNVNGAYLNEFLLGDKDMFRFAWHALRTEYGRPSRWITSIGSLTQSDPNDAASTPFYCGHTFAQHHPDPGGVIAFMHGGLVKQIGEEQMRFFVEQHGGIYLAYKRAPDDEDKRAYTHVGIRWDTGDFLPQRYKPTDGHQMMLGTCTDMYDLEPRPLEEIAPGWQETYKALGGYWKIGLGPQLQSGLGTQ